VAFAVHWYLETLGSIPSVEVHTKVVHVPPADEAGGIVITRVQPHTVT
jgi:hypothetical protein